MKTLWYPNELIPLLDVAIARLEVEYKKHRGLLFDAYSAKQVRCGFLWLKKRQVNKEEAWKLIRRSQQWESYDYAWDVIHGYSYKMRMLENIKTACSTACTGVELTQEESLILTNWSKE